jgi:hypothetical protein
VLTPTPLSKALPPPPLQAVDLGWAMVTHDRLPRKEVIQPQLPLRLPCYDFVPITSPTLDGCLPCGLAHRLQVLPAFMT